MDLVKVEDKYPALAVKTEMTPEDALLAEELEALNGVQLKFPRIKLGASGNGKLEVPDPVNTDEEKSVKELTGIIVCCTASRAKWEEGATVPECASSDAKISMSGKQCSTCKYCKFSRDCNGNLVRPQCKESRNLYLVTEEHSLPLHFIIPPSGIKEYNNFAASLLSNKKTQLGTIVKITVAVETNKANQKFNKAKFESIGRADAELLPRLIETRNQIMSIISSMTIEDLSAEEETMIPINEDVDSIF